jgi:hypothetical protein
MTLERRSGGDADDVRRDLGAAMASAARREGASARQHDARPLALEAAAIASNDSCSNFLRPSAPLHSRPGRWDRRRWSARAAHAGGRGAVLDIAHAAEYAAWCLPR